MNASHFRFAIYIAALCGLYLSTAMMIPALVDLYFGHEDWRIFAFSGFLVGGFSLLTAIATRARLPFFPSASAFSWSIFSGRHFRLWGPYRS